MFVTPAAGNKLVTYPHKSICEEIDEIWSKKIEQPKCLEWQSQLHEVVYKAL